MESGCGKVVAVDHHLAVAEHAKKWVGTDLLPDGFKVAPKAAVKDAEKDSEES